MKKLLTIFTVFSLLILSAMPVSADNTLNITFPQNGVEVSEITEFTVELSGEYDEIIFQLDGEIIGKCEAEGDIFSLPADPEKLYAGKHTLKVFGIPVGGGLISTESQFLFQRVEKEEKLNEKFNEINFDSETNVVSGGYSSKLRYSAKPDDNPVSTVTAVEGKSGDAEDRAIKISANGGGGDHGQGPYLQYSESGPYPDNLFVIEADIKPDTNSDRIAVSGSASVGGTFFAGGQKHLFGSGGKIYNSNDTSVSTTYNGGEWVHVKFIYDFAEKNFKFFMNDEFVFEKTNLTSTGFNDFSYMRIAASASSPSASADSAYTIDNLLAYNSFTYSGIKNISAVSEGNEYTENVPVNSESIRLYMYESANEEYITNKYIKFYADGKEIAITSFGYDDELKIITADFDGGLPYGAKLTAEISKDFKLADGKVAGIKAKANIVAEESDFAVVGGKFTSENATVLTPKQLQVGADIKSEFVIKNNIGDNKFALIVMTIKDGNKIVSVNAKTVEIFAGSNSYYTEANVPRAEKLNISAIVCDGWGSLKPISDIYILE